MSAWPSASEELVASRVTTAAEATDWSAPALAVGRLLAGADKRGYGWEKTSEGVTGCLSGKNIA